MEERVCLECSATLRGRADQKFCSDYCRNTFNNKVDTNIKSLIRNTNGRLKKNYKILAELNSGGKTKVSSSKLRDRGFDFQLFTSFYQSKNGNTYFYVYNQGYVAMQNDFYLLIKKEL